MARVPYTGVPSERLNVVQTSRVGVSTHTLSPASFGGAEAEANKRLGAALEDAGDTLFKRAMALQDLRNETEAKEADTKYMIKAGELHAEFNTLQGRSAVDAYPTYMENLKKAREEIGEGLSNSMSKRIYDRDTLNTMGRTIFNGANHAATQNRRAALQASEAKVTALGDGALATPTDENAFNQSVKDTEVEVGQQGIMLGWDPIKIKQEQSEKVSTLYAKRIEGLSRTKPFEASKMLDAALKEGKIRGADISNVEKVVRQQMYTVGARNISHNVTNGTDLKWGSGPVDIKAAAGSVGQLESGNNYEAIGPETGKGRALGKYQVMPFNLANFLKEAGQPNMTEAEFLKNKNAQDAVFNTVFGRYMRETGSFNDALSMWFTGKPYAQAVAEKRRDVNINVQTYVERANRLLARSSSLKDRIDKGVVEAKAISPNDPLFQDYVEQRITADYNRIQQVKRNDDYNNRLTIDAAIVGGFGKGQLPTTLEELRALDPKVDLAWNNLDDTQQKRVLKELAKNAKGDVSWSEDRMRRYRELGGMAVSDPQEFLDLDIPNEDIPWSAKRELINRQHKLVANAETDPRVTKALQVLGPDLQAAGITREFNKNTYYQFVGSLQDALKDWQEENKKAPKAEEIRAIGIRLLQEQTDPNKFSFGVLNRTSPMFLVPVPPKDYDEIKNDPKWKELGIIAPTDEQVQRIYTRRLYQKLYGGTPTKAAPPISK